MASGRSGEMMPDLPGKIISVTSPPVAQPRTELANKIRILCDRFLLAFLRCNG